MNQEGETNSLKNRNFHHLK